MSRRLKILISFVLIVGLVVYAGGRELGQAFLALTLEAVFYLALLSLALIYVSALKWKLFLEALGAKANLARLFALYLLGYFVNLLLPSYIGGDLVRSFYAGKQLGQHAAFTATILERYTGLFAMLSMAFVFVWFVQACTFEIKAVVCILMLGLVVLTLVAISGVWLKALSKIRALGSIVQHLEKVHSGFMVAKRNPALIIKTLLLSYLYHCFTVANTVVAAAAVGWYEPPLWQLFIILPLILLLGSLPLAPNGLGLQEGVFVFFLQLVGATPAQALGLALVLRAKSYILALCGGLVWLKVRNQDLGQQLFSSSAPHGNKV